MCTKPLKHLECHMRCGGVSVQVCILRDFCCSKPDVDSKTDGSYGTNAAQINIPLDNVNGNI